MHFLIKIWISLLASRRILTNWSLLMRYCCAHYSVVIGRFYSVRMWTCDDLDTSSQLNNLKLNSFSQQQSFQPGGQYIEKGKGRFYLNYLIKINSVLKMERRLANPPIWNKINKVIRHITKSGCRTVVHNGKLGRQNYLNNSSNVHL